MKILTFAVFLGAVFVVALIFTPIFGGMFTQQNLGYYQEKLSESRTSATYKIIYDSHDASIHALLTIPKEWEKVPVFVIIPAASIEKESEQRHLGAELNELGYATFIIDPRGQGATGGSVPSLANDFMLNFKEGGYPVLYKMVDDVFRAYEIVAERPEIDPERIYVAGESAGGRYAIIAAALRPEFAGLLAISSSGYDFNTVDQDAILVEYMNNINPFSYIGNISAKVAIVHGDSDGIIPLEDGRKLFDAATEPKKFFEIEGGGHSFESMDHSVIDEVIEWLSS